MWGVTGARALLSADVVLVSDGGPRRHAARLPVVGPWRVSRLLANLAGRLPASVEIDPVAVNGAAGFRLRDPAGEQAAVVAFDVNGGQVAAIWIVNNPDKLTHLDTPAALR